MRFRLLGVQKKVTRHFFCLDFKSKNMKPEKALLHTASAVLHKNESFSDETTSL